MENTKKVIAVLLIVASLGATATDESTDEMIYGKDGITFRAVATRGVQRRGGVTMTGWICG